MSIPGVSVSNERYALDNGQAALAQQVLAICENAGNFAALIAGYSDDDLLGPPYNYDQDALYSLRALSQLTAQWAAIVGAGGSVSASDGALLLELTRKAAGVWLIGASGQRVV